MEDTGKYRRGSIEKPVAKEGQEGTGDKRGTTGQLHDWHLLLT